MRTGPDLLTVLTPERLTPEAFAPFGTAVRLPRAEPLARTRQFSYWSDAARFHIEGETEIGYCTVFRQPASEVTWMERHHRTPELLIPADAPFILPVLSENGEGRAFRIEPGEAVVIGEGVWHSACHPAEGDAATYFVIFRHGTPHDDVEKRDIPAFQMVTRA